MDCVCWWLLPNVCQLHILGTCALLEHNSGPQVKEYSVPYFEAILKPRQRMMLVSSFSQSVMCMEISCNFIIALYTISLARF